jgi:hypothetical protein
MDAEYWKKALLIGGGVSIGPHRSKKRPSYGGDHARKTVTRANNRARDTEFHEKKPFSRGEQLAA